MERRYLKEESIIKENMEERDISEYMQACGEVRTGEIQIWDMGNAGNLGLNDCNNFSEINRTRLKNTQLKCVCMYVYFMLKKMYTISRKNFISFIILYIQFFEIFFSVKWYFKLAVVKIKPKSKYKISNPVMLATILKKYTLFYEKNVCVCVMKNIKMYILYKNY